MIAALRIAAAATIVLAACGDSPAPPPADPSRATPVDPATPPPPPAPIAEPITRAQAVARAEAFVAAQGYTTAPATVSGEALRREMMDPGDEAALLSARRGTLERGAAGARGGADGWMVVFRYTRPSRPGAARVVRVLPAAEPELIHQDIMLDAFLAATEPPPLVVIARLTDRGATVPHCGILHVAAEMTYEVLRVERGAHEGTTLRVIHGCPEMPRSSYAGETAGDVVEFTVGDIHRLELDATVPDGVSVIRPPGAPTTGARWARRTDRATAP